MKKIMAVSSGGGHWSQMQLIAEAFAETDIITYVTTDINMAVPDALKKHVHRVSDADITQKTTLIKVSLQTLWLLLKHRPDIVISTGAAPGFFAIFWAKVILRRHTIWVDSIANFSDPSLCGAKIKKYCDKYYCQWPELAKQRNEEYAGHLI